MEESMTSRERLLAALNKEVPDRLPVTTHHVMPWFLEHSMNGMTVREFFDHFGLDPILWSSPHKALNGWPLDSNHPSVTVPSVFTSDEWKITRTVTSKRGFINEAFTIDTPTKCLHLSLLDDGKTRWVKEPLIKEKSDIELFWRHAPVIICDANGLALEVEAFGKGGLIRGTIPGFDICGQPGCFQDAAVLTGTVQLITACLEDRGWVHAFLNILKNRKEMYINSLAGLPVDILELGGGTASTTVISPSIFEEFVAPYDTELIALAHATGKRVVYHTCGGMMPILEMIADMQPDAMETFTPTGMGGDVILREAKRRIGHRVCIIGGFDQAHYLKNCDPAETRREVRRCFEEAGEGGGFILAPSGHFFEADPECLRAFASEAKRCIYH